MVGCAPGSRQQRFWTSKIFSSALLVGLHVLVVPDLVCEVGVRDRELRGHMRNNISIVDDSVSFRNAAGDISGKRFISNSWLSKSIKLIAMAKQIFQIQTSDSCKSWSKTIACYKDLGISVKSSQFLNFSSDVTFNHLKSIVESLMNVATCAVGVGHLQ